MKTDSLPVQQQLGPAVPTPQHQGPTIFHITAHKAGSQWIRNLLLKCAPEHIVQPQLRNAHVLEMPIQEGFIYPALCITREDFNRVRAPESAKRLVIFRDLRDILVSAYFSLKYSHSEQGTVSRIRQAIATGSTEAGMLFVLKNWLPGEANIISSWVQTGEPWIRYEDLLENDTAILEKALIDQCGLGISREQFRAHVLSCRFSRMSGRKPGEEDVNSHFRKGTAGDWRNHFTGRLKRAFKWKYGRLLVQCGYEKNNWW